MEKISFIKLSAAGNDFILIDKKENEDFFPSKDIITRLCDRKNGIGADGILVFNNIGNFDFSVEHYNSDGSGNTLCGNGARCSIYYAKLNGRLAGNEALFLYNGKQMKGQLLPDDSVKLYFTNPSNIKTNFKIKAAGQLITSSYADVGSPHVVIRISDILQSVKNPDSGYTDINLVPVDRIGKEIRLSKDFAPEGTNVNFVIEKEKFFEIRTFERGVEGETLACGTGIVASALICSLKYGIKPPVKFFTRGKEFLTVDFIRKEKDFEKISLSGPAKQIFTGNFII